MLDAIRREVGDRDVVLVLRASLSGLDPGTDPVEEREGLEGAVCVTRHELAQSLAERVLETKLRRDGPPSGAKKDHRELDGLMPQNGCPAPKASRAEGGTIRGAAVATDPVIVGPSGLEEARSGDDHGRTGTDGVECKLLSGLPPPMSEPLIETQQRMLLRVSGSADLLHPDGGVRPKEGDGIRKAGPKLGKGLMLGSLASDSQTDGVVNLPSKRPVDSQGVEPVRLSNG